MKQCVVLVDLEIVGKNKLIENVKLVSSMFGKTKGLMLRKSGRILMQFGNEAKHSIWMLFMRFSLDLVFIDRNKRIVDVIRNVKPISLNPKTWKVYTPKEKCLYILEVENGLANYKSGDKLSFMGS